MGMIHLASSAKSSILVDNSVEGRSFMKMRNSIYWSKDAHQR